MASNSTMLTTAKSAGKPAAKHNHSAEPYRKILCRSTAKPVCQPVYRSARKGTQENACARFANSKGARPWSVIMATSAAASIRSTRRRRASQPLHRNHAHTAITASAQVGCRPAIKKRAGTTSSSQGPAKRARSWPNAKVSMRHATSHASIDAAASSGSRWPARNTAHLAARCVRLKSGMKGKVRAASQHSSR